MFDNFGRFLLPIIRNKIHKFVVLFVDEQSSFDQRETDLAFTIWWVPIKKKKKLKRKRLNLGQQKAKMHAIFFLLFLFFNTKELLTTQ